MRFTIIELINKLFLFLMKVPVKKNKFSSYSLFKNFQKLKLNILLSVFCLKKEV